MIEEAFINYIELALDWNLPIEPKELKLYFEIIERRKNNEP